MKRFVALLFICTISCSVRGGELAGLWQEYNDDTGNVEALIRIEKLGNGSYEGIIEKLIPESLENKHLLCTHCPGNLHNRPLLGLRILSGLKRHDEQFFQEGEILDPDDGKLYRCNIRLSDDGNSIEVTGYLSFNWIGHSEIWRRAK